MEIQKEESKKMRINNHEMKRRNKNHITVPKENSILTLLARGSSTSTNILGSGETEEWVRYSIRTDMLISLWGVRQWYIRVVVVKRDNCFHGVGSVFGGSRDMAKKCWWVQNKNYLCQLTNNLIFFFQ